MDSHSFIVQAGAGTPRWQDSGFISELEQHGGDLAPFDETDFERDHGCDRCHDDLPTPNGICADCQEETGRFS